MMAGSPYRIDPPALVSVSGGRTSGYMLWHILEAHGGTLPDDVYAVFFNTGREMPETLGFVQACGERWGVPIIWLEYDPEAEHQTRVVNHNSASRDGEPYAALIGKRQYLPNPVTRFCTVELKVRRGWAFMHKMKGHNDWDTCIGLRADERRRVAKARARNESGKERFSVTFPLHEAGVTKRHVTEFWTSQPFDLALANANGKTPLGNCDLCFLKGERTIAGIMRTRPDLAAWWIEQEARPLKTKGQGARFRADRRSYGQILDIVERQGDLYLGEPDGNDCFCTD